MTESRIDDEVKAIKTIADALEPLNEEERRRVWSYTTERLGLSVENPPLDKTPKEPETPGTNSSVDVKDIRTLRGQKQPTTDVQMAALVAYYLKELAPSDQRKETINKADIEKYFNQAGHPLPQRADLTLSNAKSSGYLESAGRGKYKLNPVGHNLVVHSLPRSSTTSASRQTTRKRRKRTAKKKVSSKKAPKRRSNAHTKRGKKKTS